MKIGVFDSGRGGHIIAERLQILFPEYTFIVADDAAHVPYGSRSSQEIYQLAKAALAPLFAEQCDVIVLACNTLTAAAVDQFRLEFPEQTFIGFEPMVKPASLRTKTGVIAILATPATIASDRYKKLKDKWAGDIRVIEPDCSTWAERIEHGKTVDIETVITPLLEGGTDQIVLACTHYLALEDSIAKLSAGKAEVLEPTAAIAERIRYFAASASTAATN